MALPTLLAKATLGLAGGKLVLAAAVAAGTAYGTYKAGKYVLFTAAEAAGSAYLNYCLSDGKKQN